MCCVKFLVFVSFVSVNKMCSFFKYATGIFDITRICITAHFIAFFFNRKTIFFVFDHNYASKQKKLSKMENAFY